MRASTMRLAAMLLWTAVAAGCAGPPVTGQAVRFTVPEGASLRMVADSLIARGLITSSIRFRVLARLTRGDRAIQAGIYDILPGTGQREILRTLRDGRVATTRITIPEGLTLVEFAELAGERLGLPSESVLVAAGEPSLRQELGLQASTLEGFLLPETYTLPLPVTPAALLEAMTGEFARRWRPEWDRRLDTLKLSRLELVTLASIVEGEARHDDERAIIAGVYHNRLRRGMALQADPTVQYAIQLKTGQRKSRLYFKDYAFPSPYNTYLHAGLPPGPVNSPGLESLEATLYPASVPWLYFVAKPDGHHQFSRTLAEHNRAISSIRRAQPQAR